MDPDELANSSDACYWDNCVLAIARGEMSIESVEPQARKYILKDVECYKAFGKLPSEEEA